MVAVSKETGQASHIEAGEEDTKRLCVREKRGAIVDGKRVEIEPEREREGQRERSQWTRLPVGVGQTEERSVRGNGNDFVGSSRGRQSPRPGRRSPLLRAVVINFAFLLLFLLFVFIAFFAFFLVFVRSLRSFVCQWSVGGGRMWWM